MANDNNYRGCVSKRRFNDENHAAEAIKRIKGRKARNGSRPTRSYYCADCKGFHLTSQDERTIKRMIPNAPKVNEVVSENRRKKADDAFAQLKAMREQQINKGP